MHIQGLSIESFSHPVYCTEWTAKIIQGMRYIKSRANKYEHIYSLLKPMPLNEPFVISTTEYGPLNITFLPANHCPGSSVILIQGCNGSVVYTGDIRAERQFVNDNLRILHREDISHLYMDTTFCREDCRVFIEKDVSLQLLADFIDSYPSYYIMYIDSWTFGFEEIWFIIVQRYKQQIHVSLDRYSLYCSIDPLFKTILTTDSTKTRFHSCQWKEPCSVCTSLMISIHPVPITSKQIKHYYPSKSSLLQSDLPRGCKPFCQVMLPYSTHSSLNEIVYLFKFIRPKSFTPCVAHGQWRTMNAIRKLLTQEGCLLDNITHTKKVRSAHINNPTTISTDLIEGIQMTTTMIPRNKDIEPNKLDEEEEIDVKRFIRKLSVYCYNSKSEYLWLKGDCIEDAIEIE
ncbi:beta-lactamase-like protein [Pilobolus umbonatus]|nr:beta-lactamase-like protein [Pilobolus umbonatus]